MPATNTTLAAERLAEKREKALRQAQAIRGKARRYIMRLPEVTAISGLKRSSIYNLMAKGDFPKSRRIGSGGAIGWDSLEITAWVDAQMDAAPIDDHLDIQDEEEAEPESAPAKCTRTRRAHHDRKRPKQ
ncbi:AlpA family phage regulatory protein [Pseudomonas sp. OV226]|uniref:AlpA family phage regulatory protein n=1 Tax=Pseudomonas sp. OV226 TaxID=2135588 RepID=UPI000D6C5522|nr:AlpA family transcriptional regulator [Pseudomonas sp. OV226]